MPTIAMEPPFGSGCRLTLVPAAPPPLLATARGVGESLDRAADGSDKEVGQTASRIAPIVAEDETPPIAASQHSCMAGAPR
ncbi:hypothetical protein GU700_05505 [Methylobacterium sp. NI91]|nr:MULTISPECIES: hypothetical protein [unclassified Methylobacterium]QIJ74084.1 hypothetical protein CLZ_05505 [Methylobacterium sp. CLZ]QIJ78988.1 hypothetical protein GU700_05505 [Methylobacterium sp. NI91]